MKQSKVMRYEIIKPIDDTWENFGRVLRDIQYDSRQILNKTIQLAWEYFNFSAEYKAKYNVYPKMQEVLDYTNIQGYAYDRLKDSFDRLYRGNLSQTIKRAADKWKSDYKEILRGDRSIPNFKKNVPIDIVSTAIKIIRDEHGFILEVNLIGSKYKEQLQRPKTSYQILIKAYDNAQKTIIERLLNGTYKLGASQILNSRNKWFININYQFESEVNSLDQEKVMGLDLGIVNPIYIAFNDSLSRYRIDSKEISEFFKRIEASKKELEEFRRNVETRRKDLLRQGKYCGEGRIGHGRATRIKPIEKMSEKIANFRDTTNHKYSRYIIDLAVKNRCGVIQMEDLSGITAGEQPMFLKNWTYYDLQQKIEYKATEAGIRVIKIDPKYTSQRCSECGHIHKENRPDQETFLCQKCGFESNADYNAAKNIATPKIDYIIKESLKEGGLE